MATVVKSAETALGTVLPTYDVNKIVDYKLEEDVVRLYLEGYKAHRIAKRCNELLAARTEDKTYIEVNHANVLSYLKSQHKEIELAKQPTEIALYKQSLNVNEKLGGLVSILETEVEKMRNDDAPVLDSKALFFNSLIGRLISALELAANIQGKLQPSINFNLYQTNITTFCDKIQELDALTPEAKRVVLELAANELVNDNLLKSVQGTEIKLDKKE